MSSAPRSWRTGSSEAAETLATASRLRPGDAPVRSNLGLALARAGQLEAARAELVEATRLAPEDVGARINLGLVLLGQGRPSEAAAQFQEAVRLAPSDSAARELLDRARREASGPRR